MRDSHEPRPTAPVAAVGVVVIHDARVLLVLRGKEPSRGLWAVPGGSVRLGETLMQAARREVLEETGVIVEPLHPVHAFDAIVQEPQGIIAHHYVVVDVLARYVSGTPRAGDDAERAEWVAADELGTIALSGETARLLRRLLPHPLEGPGRSPAGFASSNRSSDPSRSRR